MINNDLYERTIAFVDTICGKDTSGHDTEHAINVCSLAVKIANLENNIDMDKVQLAALLHDVDDHKLSPNTYETKQNARDFLKSEKFNDEYINEICNIINGVSWSHNRGKKPANIETACVQDADRITAIGAVGIARACAYGGSVGNPLSETIKHFYDKLLHVRGELNTESAKIISRPHQEIMLNFLEQYHTNMNQQCPQMLYDKINELKQENMLIKL